MLEIIRTLIVIVIFFLPVIFIWLIREDMWNTSLKEVEDEHKYSDNYVKEQEEKRNKENDKRYTSN
jgi:hypothetical protein